eukprot:6277816-Alexandrium_andersonii.AAC.1
MQVTFAHTVQQCEAQHRAPGRAPSEPPCSPAPARTARRAWCAPMHVCCERTAAPETDLPHPP